MHLFIIIQFDYTSRSHYNVIHISKKKNSIESINIKYKYIINISNKQIYSWEPVYLHQRTTASCPRQVSHWMYRETNRPGIPCTTETGKQVNSKLTSYPTWPKTLKKKSNFLGRIDWNFWNN